ncbi:T6SS effector amidase Tae4 family protein [Noviherbaspirillum sp. Root189]|uniref:T6SS effector amidase Tae4 family protein n=1 Tax=Noviherbaspirillum sp. Root189 TaxID=1736487 RepID=UPI00070F21F6|nr:T6SS effector amidase Tae4 family protein [Noviherbaspirillum sp. Root189]KRB79932.1 hypothetical protein ASE07_25140 [Noviherbaspirillum sp. Root189]
MVAFSELWRNHPKVKGDAPVLDPTAYPNQCAINLYAALVRSGFNVKTFTGVFSWQKEKPKYAICAQELANWLARPSILNSKMQKLTGKDAFDSMTSKAGIVFFQHYWGPDEQGGHVDLWNGSRLTDWTSWIRIHANMNIPGVWSDYKKAKSVWFWPIL